MSTRASRSSKRKAEEPAKAPAAVGKPVQTKSGKKKPKKGVEKPESCHDIFMKEVAQREKQLKKHCIIMEMVDTDEDETTLDQLRALRRVFVPKKVQDHFIEIWSELDEVGQDDEEGEEEADEADAAMKAFMVMFTGKCLTTRHAAEMQTILEAHLDQIDGSINAGKWQDAFCRWVATAMAARREPHWWEDTDTPDDALEIYKRLRQQWTQLKDRTDEELGGLVCDIPDMSVKDELAQYFQGLADEMKQLDYEVEDAIQKPHQKKKQPRAKKALAKQQKSTEQDQQEQPQEDQLQVALQVEGQQLKGGRRSAKKQQAASERAAKATAAAAKVEKQQKQGPSEAAAVDKVAEGGLRARRQAAAVKAVEQDEQPVKKQRGASNKLDVEAGAAVESKGKKQTTATGEGRGTKSKAEKDQTGKRKLKR